MVLERWAWSRVPGSVASLLSQLERPAQTCPGSEALPRDRGDLPASSWRSSHLYLPTWPVLVKATTPGPPGVQQRSTWGDNNVTL